MTCTVPLMVVGQTAVQGANGLQLYSWLWCRSSSLLKAFTLADTMLVEKKAVCLFATKAFNLGRHIGAVVRVASHIEDCRITFQRGAFLYEIYILFCMHAWDFSKYSSFLPLTKNRHVRVTSNCKFVYRCEWPVWMAVVSFVFCWR